MSKICAHKNCQKSKPLSEFPKDRSRKDGYGYWCKECQRAANKTSYYKNHKARKAASNLYAQTHKEEARINSKAHYEANKESISARQSKWYQENRETKLAYSKEHRLDNIDSYKSYEKAYRDSHKSERTAAWNKRRALKLNQTPPDADFKKIAEFYEESERLTRETGMSHHVDHIIPLSKGGLHHEDNLQVLTAEENLKKGNKLI